MKHLVRENDIVRNHVGLRHALAVLHQAHDRGLIKPVGYLEGEILWDKAEVAKVFRMLSQGWSQQ